jgi:hypothetical protein
MRGCGSWSSPDPGSGKFCEQTRKGRILSTTDSQHMGIAFVDKRRSFSWGPVMRRSMLCRPGSLTTDVRSDLRRRRAALAWMILVGLGILGTPACNDCDFGGTRCAGSAVEQCGGVDQQIGRTIERTPCLDLNPVCVSRGSEAYCAASETRTCTPGETRCEGNVLLRCGRLGFEVALDCTAVKIHRPRGGLEPAGYTCNQNAGSNPDCRPS